MAGDLASLQAAAAVEADLREQIYRLTQEKRELEEYAERATKELRRYQAARPPPPPVGPTDDMPLPPWATNMQMMSPLLFAYEERIAELEAVVERSVSLAEQSQALTRENDSLRAELQDRTEQLRAAQLMAPTAIEDGRDGGGVAQEDVQEIYRLSVEQNEALAHQNQLLKVQLERMQQSIVAGQQQNREFQSRVAEQSKAVVQEQQRSEAQSAEHSKALAQAHERGEELVRQRTAAEARLGEITGELVEEVRLREQLQHEIQGLQHELQLTHQGLDLAKKSFAERCSVAADEEERLKGELVRVSRVEKEQRQRLASMDQELNQMNDQLYEARREADAMKKEAAPMIKLMDSMEKRVHHFSERYDDVQAKLVDYENQNSELLLGKDRWATTEQAAKKQIERLQSRYDGEVESLKQQRDHDVEAAQSAHARFAAEAEERLRRCEQSATEFQTKAELLAKQRTWEAAEVERRALAHSSERSRLQGDLEELQQARLRLERQADEAHREATRVRSDLDACAAQAREHANKASAEVSSHKSKFQGVEQRLAQSRDEIHSLEGRVTVGLTEHAKFQAELHEVRTSGQESVEAERRKAQVEKQRLERQLRGVTTKAQQDEQKAVELLRAQEALRQRWQAELGTEKENLESQIERLAAENKAVREKSRTMLRALAARRITGGSGGGGVGVSSPADTFGLDDDHRLSALLGQGHRTSTRGP
eukprot:TRINITY_DN61998_c0_g1_i1.p1 TRINITY_DN61998_c0_g1~~TRINITY_DN61998_c0_g1_i1.p1  ORF type:complete len:730 (+),score=186.16 TRINITY_DN61998_c0_g1_i1:57-2192(+)